MYTASVRVSTLGCALFKDHIDLMVDTSVEHHYVTTASGGNDYVMYDKADTIPARKGQTFFAKADGAADSASALPALFTKRQYRQYVDEAVDCPGAGTWPTSFDSGAVYLPVTGDTCRSQTIYASTGGSSGHTETECLTLAE